MRLGHRVRSLLHASDPAPTATPALNLAASASAEAEPERGDQTPSAITGSNPTRRNTVPLGFLPPPLARSPGDDLLPMICQAIFEELCILANGDIVCSCGDPSGFRIYGNVLTDRIAEVYNGPMYREMREWQLQSKPDSWCPVINNDCGGRVYRPSAVDTPDRRTVKKLQLEPVSYCNLRCPACAVTLYFKDPDMADRGGKLLPLDVMLDVIDQLPDLELLLFYNFGEPFLHRDAIPFLRAVKRRRPDIFVTTNTNGLPLTRTKIEALTSEVLLDQISFSIDGADPDSYERYRVGGNLTKALRNLEAFVLAADAAGTRNRISINWQYILFEWNDSDAELTRAKELAKDIGVPINWIFTHTPGASKRFLANSSNLQILTYDSPNVSRGTCEVQLDDFVKNERIHGGRYLAGLSTTRPAVTGQAGSTITLDVMVENRSSQAWGEGRPGAFRLGILLRTATGKKIRELQAADLPAAAVYPGGSGVATIEVAVPEATGEYQLLIDVVEEHVCWFSWLGSSPLVCFLTAEPVPDPAGAG
jgi:pyruvate-formate lyase-activating enzyme